MQSSPSAPSGNNLFMALLLTIAIMFVWEYFYAGPKRQEVVRYQKAEAERTAVALANKPSVAALPQQLERGQALAASSRVAIRSPKIEGSIRLQGARFDDISFVQYRETLDPASPEVVLLMPSETGKGYFAEAGWASGDGTKVPDSTSVWKSDSNVLEPGKPVRLSWNNGAGVTFHLLIVLDDQYMFTIRQQVENASGKPVTLSPYALINRHYAADHPLNVILHEGPLGVFGKELHEVKYADLKEDGDKQFTAAPQDGQAEWAGITDKYWLTSLIPDGSFNANVSHYQDNGESRYQVDALLPSRAVASGSVDEANLRFFAGAKEIAVLDSYAAGSGGKAITLFDRAVDLGSLYFLTKPIFLALSYFYSHLGNFGLAILLLTIIIKLLMFPLANKSYAAMNQMKLLQPEMVKIREKFGEDKVKMNQEIMELYKKAKVNPMAGCLPLLIQLPVFFALYKVLFVTIEMRHAPFYGWIHDLSAPDPTNIFTLFGMLNWMPPTWLHLGAWPIIMTATMVMQQKLNPQPTDPIQAKMMNLLPYLFLFLFASFPAGLIIYWAWSNTLSILQQWVITRKHA